MLKYTGRKVAEGLYKNIKLVLDKTNIFKLACSTIPPPSLTASKYLKTSKVSL